MQLLIPKSRLQLIFHSDGNLYGIIKPKSGLRQVLEKFQNWTDDQLKEVKLSMLNSRKKKKFTDTCDGLIRMLDTVIKYRKSKEPVE